MDRAIGLALSGGGYRAIAFHAGVLRYLAEQHSLENVKFISTVSGGSLFAGFVINHTGMQWPTSDAYLQTTYPAVRAMVTSYDLQCAAIKRLLLRIKNWPHLFSRANIVAQAIKEDLNIQASLKDFPDAIKWSINGTTAETGKRFQLQFDQFGEYSLGYAEAPDFPLASAIAISAAFPIGIGPYSLPTKKYQWKTRPWGAPKSTEKIVKLPYRRLRIYDGGVYDNLGLEPLFNNATLQTKVDASIVVSDSSAPLKAGFNLGALNPFRVKRLIDIIMDQNRALRVRSFQQYLTTVNDGAYIWIGSIQPPAKEGSEMHVPAFNRDYLTPKEQQHVRDYPTNLAKMRPEDFDLIAQHGYEMALLSHRLRAPA